MVQKLFVKWHCYHRGELAQLPNFSLPSQWLKGMWLKSVKYHFCQHTLVCYNKSHYVWGDSVVAISYDGPRCKFFYGPYLTLRHRHMHTGIQTHIRHAHKHTRSTIRHIFYRQYLWWWVTLVFAKDYINSNTLEHLYKSSQNNGST